MSLLLDALQRADRDQRPALAPESTPQAEVGSRAWPVVRVVVPGVLVLVALLVGWWWGQQQGADVRTAVAVPGQSAPAAPVQNRASTEAARIQAGPDAAADPPSTIESVPVQVSVRKVPATAESLDPDVAALYVSAADPSSTSAPPANNATAVADPADVASLSPAGGSDIVGDVVVQESVPVLIEGEKPGSAPLESGSTEPEIDLEAMVKMAEEISANQGLVEHSSPLLESLSQARRDALPTLMYVRHDYSSTGGSTVTINRREAGVGDAVATGVRVEEILPDSVVLSFQGERFRLRALNSWVNL